MKPVFHKGEQCGVVREYSDTLMIFLLKARDPAKYRENAGSVTINNDARVVNIFDDIERDIRLIAAVSFDAAPVSGVPQDGAPEPVDAAQAHRAEAEPEAGGLPA